MNRIYKLFLTMILIFTMSPLFALENNGVDALELKGQLIGEIGDREQTPSLYSLVRQELENYYGLQDFSDPNHETGWYRVDDFLKWVQNKEEGLSNQIVNIDAQAVAFKDLYIGGNLSQEMCR